MPCRKTKHFFNKKVLNNGITGRGMRFYKLITHFNNIVY